MVEYHIKHQTDAAFFSFRDELFHILHGPVPWIDVVIVLYIIPVVILRGYKEGGEPDVVHSKLFDIVQFFNDAAKVAQSVFVCIAE